MFTAASINIHQHMFLFSFEIGVVSVQYLVVVLQSRGGTDSVVKCLNRQQGCDSALCLDQDVFWGQDGEPCWAAVSLTAQSSDTKTLSPNLSDVFEEQHSCYNMALHSGIMCVCMWLCLLFLTTLKHNRYWMLFPTNNKKELFKSRLNDRNDSKSLYTPVTYTVMKEQFVFFFPSSQNSWHFRDSRF